MSLYSDAHLLWMQVLADGKYCSVTDKKSLQNCFYCSLCGIHLKTVLL